VQLKHLIKDLVKILRETFPKSITVGFDIDPELSLVSIDPTQINQVLMNLAVNARDAMPEGGTLQFSAKNAVIDENYARLNLEAAAGEFVMISVSDTGLGIAPDILPKIFDPFFTTKEVGKGTGLGLATAQSIVKSHEGFIAVYSEPGRGSKFSVYLPTTNVRKKTQDEKSSLPYPKGKGELILLVDDEKNVLQMAAATLEKFGYRVLAAADGMEAVAAFNKNKDDVALVLTDLAMPNMDGFETVRALRSVSPDLLIIAASGLAGTDKTNDLQTLGVKSFLSKPYTAENLLTMLDDILHKKL
jgi:CheY-like chemotaxis protein